MCGIAGILRRDGSPVETALLEAMTASLSHRGPDGQGVWKEAQVGLAHRRLSIIDPDLGQQPMFNEDGSVAITFNGEIYNFRELRASLETFGHRFRTNSDTEVIIHAWEQWGASCVERCRGMFAFGISDMRQKVMFLARDHFGIKPLYYIHSDKIVAFASEIQALKPIPNAFGEIDLSALDQYLFLQYIPGPRTVFRQVRKLMPAHHILFQFDGTSVGPERYWAPTYRPEWGKNPAQWVDELDTVLKESVRRHLVSDVPFGAFLSGGMDSTAIVGYMSQVLETPVTTFSIGFEEDEFSELPYAHVASRQWHTDHHVQIVKPDALAILPQLAKHYGEPFGDSSAIPTYYVSKLARELVPMVLSGDGGDEALGGYYRYQIWLAQTSPGYAMRRRAPWKRLLRPVASRILPKRFPPDPPPKDASLATWYTMVQYFSHQDRLKLWRKEYHDIVDGHSEPFELIYPDIESYPPLCRAQLLDHHTYLPYDILTKVDVASMMHGLEVRTPFIDVEVAEFVATIPPEFRMAMDADGNFQNKVLLRRLLSRHFPAGFMERPKMGFALPIARWLEPGGALREQLVRLTVNNKARVHEYLNPSAIEFFVNAHSRETDFSGHLWILLFLESWLENVLAI